MDTINSGHMTKMIKDIEGQFTESLKEMKKDFNCFKINKDSFPKYDNAESFATRFKRCSIYEYGNTSYSNNSNPTINKKEKQNA